MKTSLVIDEEKLDLAKRVGHEHTIRNIVDKALDAYIAECRRMSLHDLLGNGAIQMTARDLAHARGKTVKQSKSKK